MTDGVARYTGDDLMPQTVDIMENHAAKCRLSKLPNGDREPCRSCKYILRLVREVRRLRGA
jgi:hypothetical protein